MASPSARDVLDVLMAQAQDHPDRVWPRVDLCNELEEHFGVGTHVIMDRFRKLIKTGDLVLMKATSHGRIYPSGTVEYMAFIRENEDVLVDGVPTWELSLDDPSESFWWGFSRWFLTTADQYKAYEEKRKQAREAYRRSRPDIWRNLD